MNFWKPKNKGKLKFLIGILLLSIATTTGIGVTFADENITSNLYDWFNKKGEESINTIDQSIAIEKEAQKQRLKAELELEIKRSAEDLNQFTGHEEKESIKQIQEYADKIIANLHVDNQDKKNKVSKQLDSIVKQAISDMKKVGDVTEETSKHHKGEKENEKEESKVPSNLESNSTPSDIVRDNKGDNDDR